MRRLAFSVTLAALLFCACKPRDKIRLEPTEENLELFSTVHMADPRSAQQLIRGFHAVEQNSWRWTRREFSVLLKPPPDARKLRLAADVSVPETVIQQLGSVTLNADLNGTRLGSATWAVAGSHRFEADLPAGSAGAGLLTVDFSLDKYFPAGTADERELGLIVSQVLLESR